MNVKTSKEEIKKKKKSKVNGWAGGDYVTYRQCGIRDTYARGWHELPVRALLATFRSLGGGAEVDRGAARVCRKWRRVAQLPELWRHVEWGGKGKQVVVPPTPYMCRRMRTVGQQLTELRLHDVPDIIQVLRQLALCKPPNLEKLAIEHCTRQLPAPGLVPEAVLRHVINACASKLRDLSLKGTEFSAQRLYVELARLPTLQGLNLSHNKHVSGRNLLELSLNCRALSRLKLTHRHHEQPVTHMDLMCFFRNVKRNVTLLCFDAAGLPDMVFKIISECTNLEKLALYNAVTMSTDSFLRLAENLPNLQFLKIQKMTVPSTAFVKFFQIGSFQQLEVVHFIDCWKFDTRGLEALTKSCRFLEKLNIKNCSEISKMCAVMSSCARLRELNVAYCTNLSENDIIQTVGKLPKLETLTLDCGSDLRRKTLKHIAKCQPHLHINIAQSQFNNATTAYENNDMS